MRILVKFPSRGRPEKLKEVLTKYVTMAINPSNMQFMITLDSDDQTATIELVHALMSIHQNITVYLGISGTKVKAINRDMDRAPPFDILLLASDDMIPVVHGYDEIIRTSMRRYYPDTDGVLWFNDGIQGNGLNTLSIMGKKYYQRFGYIYNPIYKTAWCDNEFTQVSKRLGRQTYFSQIIIEHQHFINGKAPIDETYLRNDNGLDSDSDTYKLREEQQFGVPKGIKLANVRTRIYR